MDDFESLSHSKWECKYHVVFIPKYRRRGLYGELRKHLGDVFRILAMQKECKVEEGHLMPDHVHMMFSIPPKYAVLQVVGYIKGKSATMRATPLNETQSPWFIRAPLTSSLPSASSRVCRTGGDPSVT